MRVLEIAAFVTLSGALHVAALTLAPPSPGGGGGGEGGTADISLQAATPTLAAMVADWDHPPATAEAPTLLQPEAQVAPDRPAPEVGFAPISADSLPMPAAQEAPPTAETRLPAPPTAFAQAAPDALSVPDMAVLSPVLMPMQTDTAVLVAQPSRLEASQGMALPQIDTAPPSGQYAPAASLRPEHRPEHPVKTPSQAAQPAQKARGAGQTATARAAPTAQNPAPSGPSKAQLVQLEQQWGAGITAALRRAHRPPSGNRATGTVKLVLSITPAGLVTGVSLAASSGNARLDQAALTAVKRARFPRAPQGLTKASYRFSQRLTVSR
jgi:periplasmic protein TonB